MGNFGALPNRLERGLCVKGLVRTVLSEEELACQVEQCLRLLRQRQHLLVACTRNATNPFGYPLHLSSSILSNCCRLTDYRIVSLRLSTPQIPAAAAADAETGKTLALVHTGTRAILLLLVFAAALFLDCLCLCLKASNDIMQRPSVDHDSRFHRVHDLRRVDQRLRVPLLGLIPNNEPMLHLLPGYVVQLRARPR